MVLDDEDFEFMSDLSGNQKIDAPPHVKNILVFECHQNSLNFEVRITSKFSEFAVQKIVKSNNFLVPL